VFFRGWSPAWPLRWKLLKAKSERGNAMLGQIEAAQPRTAIINTDDVTTASINATVVSGTPKTISFSMPANVPGVTASSNTVTTTPGNYSLVFTMTNDTFSQQDPAITLSTPVGLVFVMATSSTTATVNNINTLETGDQSDSFSMTFNLVTAGIIDPTIVNDPPQT
jgi:hypothetical protein